MTYVKIFIDFLQDAENLNDAQLGRLVRAMLQYANRAIEPNLRGREAILWPTMRKQIDREFENYEKICERNRKNRNAKKKASNSPAPSDFPALSDFPTLSNPLTQSLIDQW